MVYNVANDDAQMMEQSNWDDRSFDTVMMLTQTYMD